jgi:hypothetical protein
MAKEFDPRWMYLLLFIVVGAPLIRPLGLPLPITAPVLALYNKIESLPPGSVVLFEYGVGAASWPEHGPSIIAVLKHLLSKNVKIILISLYTAEGPTLFATRIKPAIASYLEKKTYGVDYVDFGFVTGYETAMAAIAEDMHKALPRDVYGTPVDQIPLMKNVRSARDLALVIATGYCEPYIRQFYTPYGVPVAIMTWGMNAPGYMPYISAGQLCGMVAGIRAAAEYEILIKSPGEASASSDALSLSHLFIVVLIVIGNIQYYLTRRRGGT